MKSINLTIELSDTLATALEQFVQDREQACTLPIVVRLAVETFLSSQGYLHPHHKSLRITPALQGSGFTDTSINHDAIISSSCTAPAVIGMDL